MQNTRNLIKLSLLQPSPPLSSAAAVLRQLASLKIEQRQMDDLAMVCASLDSLETVAMSLAAKDAVEDLALLSKFEAEGLFHFLEPAASATALVAPVARSSVQLWLPSMRAQSLEKLEELRNRCLLAEQAQKGPEARRIRQLKSKIELACELSTIAVEFLFAGGRDLVSAGSEKRRAGVIATLPFAASEEQFKQRATEWRQQLREWKAAVAALRSKFSVLNHFTTNEVRKCSMQPLTIISPSGAAVGSAARV